MAAPTPLFRFAVDKVSGVVLQTAADRVVMILGHLTGGVTVNLAMSADEARAMANALYEAADASEKALPVVTVAAATEAT